MKVFVFSIGENTTDLVCELMKNYGFEVILYKDQTTLWDKLKRFYTEALESKDQEFFRIDADVIPLKNPKEMVLQQHWTCATGFDWYKMDVGAISIHRMSREVVEHCLHFIDEAKKEKRPETYLWRKEKINKSTTLDYFQLLGIHGYGQKDQRHRIKKLKAARDQKYNWDLLDKIEAL